MPLLLLISAHSQTKPLNRSAWVKITDHLCPFGTGYCDCLLIYLAACHVTPSAPSRYPPYAAAVLEPAKISIEMLKLITLGGGGTHKTGQPIGLARGVAMIDTRNLQPSAVFHAAVIGPSGTSFTDAAVAGCMGPLVASISDGLRAVLDRHEGCHYLNDAELRHGQTQEGFHFMVINCITKINCI